MRLANTILCIAFFILFLVEMFTKDNTNAGTNMLIFACYFSLLAHLDKKP